MKYLTLLRHAKSSWDDPVARDFDRPLNDKGKRAARTIGTWMAREGLSFDHVVASPAARVIATLECVGEGLGETLEPSFDKRIYMASAATLIDVLRDSPAEAGRVLMAGHNPGMEELALALAGDGAENEGHAAICEKYPTGSVAEIELDIESWGDAHEGCGRIVRFTRPRDLDPALGPDRG